MSNITLNEHKELTVYTDSHSQQAFCRPLPALLSSSSPPPVSFSPLPREDDELQAQHAYKVTHKSINYWYYKLFGPTHFLLSSSSCFLLLSSSSFLFLSLSISSWSLRSLAASSSRRRRSRSYVITHTNYIIMTSPKGFSPNLFLFDLPHSLRLLFLDSLLLLS